MPIVYIDWITREQVQKDRESRFVFGDNQKREGYGGQAKAMRGEPNAIGIATKWGPNMLEPSFFSDTKNFDEAWITMAIDFSYVLQALAEGRNVYVPKDGLGTGLSQLPTRAPKLYALIRGAFEAVSENKECPWPKS